MLDRPIKKSTIEKSSRLTNPILQSSLKGRITTTCLDVGRDRRPNDIRNREMFDAGNRLERLSLLFGEADRHGFGGLHCDTNAPKFRGCQHSWYHGITVAIQRRWL